MAQVSKAEWEADVQGSVSLAIDRVTGLLHNMGYIADRELTEPETKRLLAMSLRAEKTLRPILSRYLD